MVKRALEPLGLKQVELRAGFWGPRTEVNRRVTIPHIDAKNEESGRNTAIRLEWQPDDPRTPHIHWDSDVAKWVEAVAYSLTVRPDPDLERRVEEIVQAYVRMQQPDGYINSHYTLVEPEMRWKNLRDGHELYCAGTLMEASIAYYQATGKREFLDAVIRYTDTIDRVFGPGPGQRPGYPGHQEIELALVKLYRTTGEERYLRLARFFVDERGKAPPHYFDVESAERGEDPDPLKRGAYRPYDYNQSHQPVRRQHTAEGHAVRAMYLYAGMADVAAETGDAELYEACLALWDNVTGRRMYITGGIGPQAHGERFTVDYDLPNETAYAETCASIGLIFWAHRMLQFAGESRYADVLERALYNGVLSGVSLEGDSFFYSNKLAAYPSELGRLSLPFPLQRQSWYRVACCPANIARLLASLGRYAYSRAPEAIYVHLYADGTARADVGGSPVSLRVSTDYPWDGEVTIDVDVTGPHSFTLALREPGWCRGQARVKVNGESWDSRAGDDSGYLKITRSWEPGDTINLSLPMDVKLVRTHPAVRANSGRAAVMRGPLVYCFEEADNGEHLDDLVLEREDGFLATFDPDLLGGVVKIVGTARRTRFADWRDELYCSGPIGSEPTEVLAVPYYAWGNRGEGNMLVWMRA